ncbi:STELLO glycosyltransferase family protein [Methylobacterium sp. J-072]|uniref:STELLO glycosyltransferase family protein n=1 Tax=Methylobacterium sp. J-072 TaxID=2836651 RepID=UPI001FBB276E|nr:STELLO glycosyltransferase family protein [Methylobacterium sp. J-072]MCJ2095875.1 STELLO glycosyltransferase family protein [Methylobacterium sp. J-072]
MSEHYAVVITSINPPTRAVTEIARDAGRLNAQFIIVGDHKSPPHFSQTGATYLDLEAQVRTGFRYASDAPTQHYARKNIGYLYAIAAGATVLVETDDDNIPRPDFWLPRTATVSARVVEAPTWVNVYRYFHAGLIWPRGLPLDQVNAPLPDASIANAIYCPIQQGLADENPDVDAIYRLLLPIPFSFEQAEPVALRSAWCPFNSQNTTWWPEAFPLLYLPYHCSFRMTDIWRSFVAQRIAYANGWGVLFHAASVFQERNAHDLMRDFAEEVPGYLHNTAIREALEGISLRPGTAHIADGMRSCYERLVALDFVGRAELPLLEAWLEDLRSCSARSPVDKPVGRD